MKIINHVDNNMSDNVLVSIVTVVYNAVAIIEATILSVINQKNSNVEYIIIDGGSTDGTIDIIKKYNDKIDFWKSEPDRGIYDAMNKGVACASGKWILNINAGDTLKTIPLDYLLANDKNNIAAICGSVLLDNKKCLKSRYSWILKIRNTLPHQALFYNKKMLYSSYNLNYKVYADYAYNLGMLKRNLNVKIIDVVIANHSTDGISNNRDTAQEFFRLVKNEEGYFYLSLSFLYFRFNGVLQRLKKVINV